MRRLSRLDAPTSHAHSKKIEQFSLQKAVGLPKKGAYRFSFSFFGRRQRRRRERGKEEGAVPYSEPPAAPDNEVLQNPSTSDQKNFRKTRRKGEKGGEGVATYSEPPAAPDNDVLREFFDRRRK